MFWPKTCLPVSVCLFFKRNNLKSYERILIYFFKNVDDWTRNRILNVGDVPLCDSHCVEKIAFWWKFVHFEVFPSLRCDVNRKTVNKTHNIKKSLWRMCRKNVVK